MPEYSRRPVRKLALTVAVCVCVTLVVAAWTGNGYQHGDQHGYRDGPPLGHTGAFDEPTCQSCHFGAELNDSSGQLFVSLPATYVPDSVYALVIELSAAELGAGGFQLSVRDSVGGQLGTLSADGAAARIDQNEAGVAFAFHTLVGSEPIYPDKARWEVQWTAPHAARGTAIFSIAANAGNGDNSEFGDRIYQTTHTAHAVTQRSHPD